ncbi:unnamed protein product [Rodentolepis nana]|uniref:Bulb-type lectin domain-containing protein n=1 Tax=Rodentolepis nana TaxID=102285 RepID=A0A0R3T8W4_RODNA|nr:unnamed protein product [Rodentolepis nana]
MRQLIYLFVFICSLFCCVNSIEVELRRADYSGIEMSDDLYAPMAVSFPSFRLYHPDTKTYVSKSNNSYEILATERFLFSRLIEWEWIPLQGNSGIYLRNKVNGSYLCFNKYGRPIARERIEDQNCFLRGFIPVTNKKDVKKDESIITIDNGDGVIHLKELTDYVNVKPQPIYLLSKFYSPPWITGFCPNGNSFSNDDPLLPRCHHKQRSRNWSMFYLCPILPESCRRGMCIYSTHLFQKYYTGCSRHCTYSIQCGGLLTQKYGNIEFD